MKSAMIILWSIALATLAAEEPKPVVIEEPKPSAKTTIEQLSSDEIQYVRDLFHNAVVDTAINFAIVATLTPSGDAVVSITHPSASGVVKFLQSSLFKDARDMETQIFTAVYSAAANAGQHSLNLQGEKNFLRSKIQEKNRADPKFFDALLAVVKEAVK